MAQVGGGGVGSLDGSRNWSCINGADLAAGDESAEDGGARPLDEGGYFREKRREDAREVRGAEPGDDFYDDEGGGLVAGKGRKF